MCGAGADMFFPVENPVESVDVSFINKKLLVASLAAEKGRVQINCYFDNENRSPILPIYL
jgi:hypothetical protein